MKILLQINSVVNKGSTGRIAEGIGKVAMKNGWESHIAYGRDAGKSESQIYKVGDQYDVYKHVAVTRFLDRHGFSGRNSTKKLIQHITEINPDIVHLQNIHGYYLHIGELFSFLEKFGKPVVWTLHDSWSYTGHCAYYMAANCDKWKTQCNHCPIINSYPESLWIDQSSRNFSDKKKLFNSLKNLTIVTPSEWLANEVRQSFLKNNEVKVINNGININDFKPVNSEEVRIKYGIDKDKIVLGVASEWSERKGLQEFIKLSEKIDDDTQIVLVGIEKEKIENLPHNILGIPRTESVNELAQLYSLANVFVNPTKEDNFPTTNLEALACGTPVITYKTGGSPESVDSNTGIIVQGNNLEELLLAVNKIIYTPKEQYEINCRKKAEHFYDENLKFAEYLEIYKKLLQ